jgi:acyl carrier protein
MIDQDKIREILAQAGLEVTTTAGDFDKPFKDIGLDSLDVFNFLSEIEVALGKSISDSEFESINTLNDVIEFLND